MNNHFKNRKVKALLVLLGAYLLIGVFAPGFDWLRKNRGYGGGINRYNLLAAGFIGPAQTAFGAISCLGGKCSLLVDWVLWPLALYRSILSDKTFNSTCSSLNDRKFDWEKMEFGVDCLLNTKDSCRNDNLLQVGDRVRVFNDCCTHQGMTCSISIGEDLRMKTSTVYIDPILD